MNQQNMSLEKPGRRRRWYRRQHLPFVPRLSWSFRFFVWSSKIFPSRSCFLSFLWFPPRIVLPVPLLLINWLCHNAGPRLAQKLFMKRIILQKKSLSNAICLVIYWKPMAQLLGHVQLDKQLTHAHALNGVHSIESWILYIRYSKQHQRCM